MADEQITWRLVHSLAPLDVRVLDRLIVGKRVYSLAESRRI